MDNSNGSINPPGTPVTIRHSPRTARQSSDVSQSIASLSNMSPPTPSNHSRSHHSHNNNISNSNRNSNNDSNSNSNSNRNSISSIGNTTPQRDCADDLSDDNHSPNFRHHHKESAPLLDTRNSSYSYSLSRSLDTGHYSDSLDGSPLLYGESFVDHQHMQRQSRDHLLERQLQQGQCLNHDGSQRRAKKNNSVQRGFQPSDPSKGPSLSTTRSGSFSSHTSRPLSARQTQGSSGSSPRLSEHSGSSNEINRIITEETLIMPQITTASIHDQLLPPPQQRTPPQQRISAQNMHHITSPDTHLDDRGRPSYLTRSPSLMGPRMMTPSPVPLHARLSKLQKDARRGARVLDMDSHGASHHYDYEDVTDSSYDFSSRRHSVAEEDVCYPLQTTNLDIDYSALEEYIRQEQAKTQTMMTTEQTPPKGARGSQQQARSRNTSSGILSKLKGATLSSSFGSSALASKGKDANYGSVSKTLPVPERSYSLFGERDKSQIPLDDAYRFTLYSTASVTVHAQTLGEIPPRGQTLSNMLQTGYFWLDVLAPTDEEIRMLSQVFRIHPLTTEDILMEEGREKCEMFLNYYFVCFRTFVLDPNSHNYLQALSVYTLVLPGGIISYHFRPVPHCRNVRKRIRHLKERMEVTPDWINYAIIDDIVDTFAPLIRQVEAEVDMIDELVLILKESEQTDMLRRIGNCRKRVMSLLRLLTGKADVIKGLIKRYEGRMGPKGMGEIGLFMGDIQDHIITMLQNLSHYEKILSRSHSNYLAQINIEMTSASNETNDVLTKLTVLGSILLPMNLVTGLWGMNVPVPGQESEDLTWFFWIVTAIFLAASLFLLIARKIKLL